MKSCHDYNIALDVTWLKHLLCRYIKFFKACFAHFSLLPYNPVEKTKNKNRKKKETMFTRMVDNLKSLPRKAAPGKVH